ncbi:YveK family protein [Enterococcus sp. LJL90]
MEETISLREIFNILKKRLALIITLTFVGLGVASVITFFVITPEYSSRSQIIVTLPQNASGTTTVNDVNTNLQMINTYTELITSDRVIDAVQQSLSEEYGYDSSTGALREAISVVQNTDNSLMFYIQALTDDPVMSQNIANVTSNIFQTTAAEVLNNTIDQISIISSAQAEMSPVSPNNTRNLLIGIVLGFILGVGLAFLFELLDRTVKDDRFVSENLEFTVLGVVPNMAAKELNSSIKKATTINQATETSTGPAIQSGTPQTQSLSSENINEEISRRTRRRV